MTGLASITSCPSLEELTAFTEGHLTGEARARILRHLNRCPLCREVLAEAAQLEEDLLDKIKDVAASVAVPFPRKLEEQPPQAKRRRRLGSGLRWAAAIVVVLGGLCLWGRWLWAPPALVSSDDRLRDFILAMTPNQRQILFAAVLPANRGLGDGGSLDQGLEFHYGELLADRAAACAVPAIERNQEDDRCKRAENAIGLLLKDNPGAPKTPQEMRPYLDLQLGRWNEAARLALEARQAQYFENRDVRRFPAWLLRHDRWPRLSEKMGYSLVLPADAKTALEKTSHLLSQKEFDPGELSTQIGEIAAAYRALADPIESEP